MNENIDSRIPMAMASASMDTSIPRSVDSRLPLSVKPFEPIDPFAAESNSLDLQNKRSAVNDQIRDRAEKQLDKFTLKNYLEDGGDLYTTNGYEKALKDLKGKVSAATYMNLSGAAAKRKDADIRLKDNLQKLDDDTLSMLRKKSEFADEMMSGPIAIYDKTLKETGDTEKAKAAFSASKLAVIQQVAGMTGADGQPMYKPETLQQFEQATPEVIRGRLAHSKAYLDMMQKASTVRLHEAQANAADALSKNRTQGKDLTSLKAIDDALSNNEITADEAKALKAKATSSGGKGAGQSQLDDNALEALAIEFRTQGMKALTRQGPIDRAKIIAKAAEMAKADGNTPESENLYRMSRQSNQLALNRLTTQEQMILSFEKTAGKQLDMLVELGKKVPKSDWPILNKALIQGEKSIAGSPEANNFLSTIITTQGEIAKIMTGSTSAAGVSDSARREAAEMLSPYLSQDQLESLVPNIKRELENRRQGFSEQKKELLKSSALPKGNQESSKVSPSAQKHLDSDKPMIYRNEMKAARDRLAAAKTPEEKQRAQDDIAGVAREAKREGISLDGEPPKAASPDDIQALIKKYAK